MIARPYAAAALALLLALAWPAFALAIPAQPDVSIETLKSKLDTNPENLKIRYLLGRALAEKGLHAEAVGHFQAILSVRPVPAVMLQLGISLAKLGDLQNAVFQWDEIIKKYRPNSLTTLGYLGLALHKLAQSSDDDSRRFELHMSALDYFKRILRLDPGNVKARLYAGAELAKLGKIEQAVRQWLLAVRSQPRNIQAWVLLTRGLYRLQKMDKVRLAVNRILALDPSNIFAREMSAKLDKLSPSQASADAQQAAVVTPAEVGPMDSKGPVEPPRVDTADPSQGPPGEEAQEKKIPRPEGDLPSVPAPGGQMSLQAEQLFLDGLDYKEKGNYEKALYSFLQAIDVDPKFSQVYLQIGEVYLALARLAPTKNQFEERIQLAVQALKKVSEFTPGSLLAHAARAKEVLVTRLARDGFSAYHLTSAQKAVAEERPEDAFEEYVLLLSNGVFNAEVFYDLGWILPRLTGGNMQDLQFFLEELYGQHKDNYLVEYLLGKTYSRLGKVNEAAAYVGKFVEHAEILAPHVAKFLERTAAPKTDMVDLFVSARLLIKRQDRKEALARLTAFLKAAKPADLFYSEAGKLKGSIGDLLDAGLSRGFEDEKKEVLGEIPRAKALFGEYFKPEMVDDKLAEDLKVLLTNHSENMLGRFMSAWTAKLGAASKGLMQKEVEKAAEDTFMDLLAQKSNNPDWHLAIGVQALSWSLADTARAHLKVAGDLLLAKGRLRSSRHAVILLEAATRQIEAHRLDDAAILLEHAHIIDIKSLNYHLVRSRYLMERGRSADAFYALMELVSSSFGDSWFRMVLLTDLGLILFRATLLALLLASALLVIRYFEDLHHLLSELWQQKGLLLPFSLAIAIFLVLVFPTGLVIFLPALTWPMLRADEKRAFTFLVGLLLAVPVVLPVSFSDNFDLLRAAERVRAGEVAGAREFFEKFLKTHPGDYNASYLLGLVGMMEGDGSGLESARKIFKDLSAKSPNDGGVWVNIGNLEAARGDMTAALDAYNRSLSKSPNSKRAFFNISSVYAKGGQQESSDKNLKWARTLPAGEDQLARYEAASFTPPRLLLMYEPITDARLAGYFTLAGGFGLMALDGPIVLFLCWFVFGGGLVGFLIFTRERLDVLMRRCHHCLRIVCNGCQKVQDQKAYCVHCSDDSGRKKVSTRDRVEQLRSEAFKKAAAFNLVLPGTGFFFLGQSIAGSLVALLFLVLALGALSKGGWLANYLYQPVDPLPLQALRAGAMLAALTIYGGAQALFFRLRSSVQ